MGIPVIAPHLGHEWEKSKWDGDLNSYFICKKCGCLIERMNEGYLIFATKTFHSPQAELKEYTCDEVIAISIMES